MVIVSSVNTLSARLTHFCSPVLHGGAFRAVYVERATNRSVAIPEAVRAVLASIASAIEGLG